MLLPAGLGGAAVPMSSATWLLQGRAAALLGLGGWMLVPKRTLSPFPLLSHCMTPLSAEQSCAALEQSVAFSQRPVPAFGRQGEWCAWPGGAAGD